LIAPIIVVFAVGVVVSQAVLLYQLIKYGEDVREKNPLEGPVLSTNPFPDNPNAPSNVLNKNPNAPSRVLDPKYPYDLNPPPETGPSCR
jgi:hypothetical protein